MKNHIITLKECGNYRLTWDNEDLILEDRKLLEALKAFAGQTELAFVIQLYQGLTINEFMSRIVTETWYEIKELHEKSGFKVTSEAIEE